MSTFHCFSRLPSELRCAIWQAALPAHVRQHFYHYEHEHWIERVLDPSEEDFRPDDECDNNIIEYREELMDGPSVRIPLAFTSHEARSVAQAWARGQGLLMRPSTTEGEDPVFHRRFNPDWDVLNIGHDDWWPFTIPRQDFSGRPASLLWNISYISIDQFLLMEARNYLADTIGEIPDTYRSIERLYIRLEEPAPGCEPKKGDSYTYYVEPRHSEIFVWDADEGRFDVDCDACDANCMQMTPRPADLFVVPDWQREKLGQYLKELAQGLVQAKTEHFEVIPVPLTPVLAY